MLVLSRRPNEKILFPNIGVSVEIIETRGNTVRLGIDAPKHIRILRDELAESADFNPASQLVVSNQMDMSAFSDQQRHGINDAIEEISLAIALAQNQQRQGLSNDVEIAFEHAIERLNELKDLIQLGNQPGNSPVVCESVAVYQLERNRMPLSIGEDRGHSPLPSFRLDFDFALDN